MYLITLRTFKFYSHSYILLIALSNICAFLSVFLTTFHSNTGSSYDRSIAIVHFAASRTVKTEGWMAELAMLADR